MVEDAAAPSSVGRNDRGDSGAIRGGLRATLRPPPHRLARTASPIVSSVTFDVLVEVRLRPGIADPEGLTIERALPALGFSGVTGVSVGKAFRLSIEAATAAEAAQRAEELATRLLANPVIEDSTVTVGEP